MRNVVAKSLDKGRSLLLKGDKRSVVAKKHIALSLFVRGLSAVVGFVMVPLILGFLGDEKYGVWVTLWSLLNWLNILDLGMGNGLRNKFAEAKAKGDIKLVRTYVSTAYIGVTMLSGILLLVYLIITKFITWDNILNSPDYLHSELALLMQIIIVFFVLTFITKIIGKILFADQKAGINNSIEPVANIISLIIIAVLLIIKPEHRFVAIGTAISGPPLLVYIAVSIYFFSKNYKEYRPSLKYYDKTKLRGLMSLGIQFFVIQLAGIVVMLSGNLIISHMFGPEQVTPFANARKLFMFIYMPIFVTVLNTLWSAFTDAYTRKDIFWINGVLRKLEKIWVLITIITAILVVFSKHIFTFWLGKESAADIPFSLSLFSGLFIVVMTWTNIYAYIINGIGKVRIMLWGNVFSAIIIIPLCFLFGRGLDMGITGIVIATIITQVPFVFAFPYQVRRILKGTAKGIWNK